MQQHAKLPCRGNTHAGEFPAATVSSKREFLAFNAAFGQILAAVAMISANAGLVLKVVPLYERAWPILRGLPEIDPGRPTPTG